MTRRTGSEPSRRPPAATLPGCPSRLDGRSDGRHGERRMARQLDRVGVVGLGTMGAGIAEVFARSGLDVVAVEPDEAGLARGRGHLERSTARAVSRGRLPEAERQALL